MPEDRSYLPFSHNMNRAWRGTAAQAIRFCCLLLAVAYLIFFQLSADAPFWHGSIAPPAEAGVDRLLSEHDPAMRQAAGTSNLLLHFGGDPRALKSQSTRLTAMYFDWNYLQFPRQVLIGKGDKVINGADELLAADVVPDDGWLRTHEVAGVLTLIAGPDGLTTHVRRP